MAPKGKAKAKPKAKPEAKPEAEAEAKESPASPAAGSGLEAVRQQREEAEATLPKEEPPAPEPPEHRTAPEAVEVKESPDVDLSSIADPWAEVSDSEAMAHIKEEDWEVITYTKDELPSRPAQLNAKDWELKSLEVSAAKRRWLVSADLSENVFKDVELLGGPMWLRHLNLAMNPLESFDSLATLFPRLLVLDVSFTELSDTGAWYALAELPRLRRLIAEGCNIASLEDMEPLKALESLELVENALEELKELDYLAKRCPKLLELDLRENELVYKPGYAKKVEKCLPKLTWLDNQSRKKYVAKGAAASYEADALKEKDVTAVDGMFKNESCSCLEGNPCLDPATCKDWANREKVAAEARKKKGLRDDSGKML